MSIIKNHSDDIPHNLFGLQLESSLKQLDARLNEIGIMCCSGIFCSLFAAEKIASRIALLYNTREAISSTLSSLGDIHER